MQYALFVLEELRDEWKNGGNGLFTDEMRDSSQGGAHMELIRATQILEKDGATRTISGHSHGNS